MHSYELRWLRKEAGKPRSYNFKATSLGGALDVAKNDLLMERGRLYEDGQPVCYLELVEGTGVWLVGSPDLAEEGL